MLAFKRGKGKYNADFKMADFYKKYCEMSDHPVSPKQFHEAIKALNCYKFICMVQDGEQIRLPYRLGTMRVRKRRKELRVDEKGLDKRTLPVRWKDTKLMWEEKYPGLSAEEIAAIPVEEKGLIYEWNEKTDMYQMKYFWDKRQSTVKNKAYYTFKAVRNANQLITQMIELNSSIQYKYFE